jgi:uncharacterized membrane protein YhhN
MAAIFFALFCLSSIVNIAAIIFEKQCVRLVSKLCLMPFLILFTFFQPRGFPFPVLLALLFSWFGDILLVKPKKVQLYLGIGSFLLAHIFYIFTYTSFIHSVNISFAVMSFIIVFMVEYLVIKKLHLPKAYQISIIIYGTIIGLLLLFSLQVFAEHKNRYSFLLVAGSISFLISDTVLAYYNTVKTMTKQPLSFVMATYVIAQAAIIIGCINLR